MFSQLRQYNTIKHYIFFFSLRLTLFFYNFFPLFLKSRAADEADIPLIKRFSASSTLLLPDNDVPNLFLGNRLNLNPKLYGNILDCIIIRKQYSPFPVLKSFCKDFYICF